nr:MAG TPA: hypothetical protein [Caudoviricetes sp.]
MVSLSAEGNVMATCVVHSVCHPANTDKQITLLLIKNQS